MRGIASTIQGGLSQSWSPSSVFPQGNNSHTLYVIVVSIPLVIPEKNCIVGYPLANFWQHAVVMNKADAGHMKAFAILHLLLTNFHFVSIFVP